VPPLNAPGDTTVPECGDFTESFLPPGGELKLEALQPGVHKYQCCFHPWMRAEIRVD
jgi:plastocyanin